MIDAQLVGLNRLMLWLGQVPARADARIDATMREQVTELHAAVVSRMESLFHNPGRMEESLSDEVKRDATGVTGTVTASGLPYLKIQNYGGITAPHDIVPVRAGVLAFLSPGSVGFSGGIVEQGMVFAKIVHHPGSRMPQRNFMESALTMRRQAIIAAFGEAVSVAKAA